MSAPHVVIMVDLSRTGHTLIAEEKKETLKKQPGMGWNGFNKVGTDSNRLELIQIGCNGFKELEAGLKRSE